MHYVRAPGESDLRDSDQKFALELMAVCCGLCRKSLFVALQLLMQHHVGGGIGQDKAHSFL